MTVKGKKYYHSIKVLRGYGASIGLKKTKYAGVEVPTYLLEKPKKKSGL
jgi:hypothetical protein